VLALEREGYLRLRADFPTIALALQEALLRELAVCVRAALDASPPEAPPTDQRAVGPLVGSEAKPSVVRNSIRITPGGFS
jgi:hypothetical protein